MIESTTIINLFAGPGAGKTSCAWGIASEMKKQGLNVEYVPEFAKELVWDNNLEKLNDQRFLFETQSHRIDRLIGKVDFIVTDSPVLLNVVYDKEHSPQLYDDVLKKHREHPSLNFFIGRDAEKFEAVGRIHDKEQSEAIDGEIKSVLAAERINYQEVNHDNEVTVIMGAVQEQIRIVPAPAPALSAPSNIDEAYAQLEQGIKDLMTSDKYRDYLAFCSNFNNYSFNNLLLIHLQKPRASFVAGFGKWKDYGRSINKGEKGIKIFAPAPYTRKREEPLLDDKGNQVVIDGVKQTKIVEEKIPAYKLVNVFDVSQTNGEPLPSLINELTDSYKDFDTAFSALKAISPYPITFEDMDGNMKGYCSPGNKMIAIKTGLSEAQTIKTAIHEIAHAMLHSDTSNLELTRSTKEVEAESVAFLVSNHLGVDTSDYTFGYIASWAADKELNQLKSSLDAIQKTASNLIFKIDAAFEELSAEKEKAAAIPATAVQENSFSIYQLKPGDETRNLRFEPLERIHQAGLEVDKNNYDLVYTSPLADTDTLDTIYERFNINHPADFTGHSLSVSDIVVIHASGVDKAHYVDSIGFSELDGFKELPSPSPMEPTGAACYKEAKANIADERVIKLQKELKARGLVESDVDAISSIYAEHLQRNADDNGKTPISQRLAAAEQRYKDAPAREPKHDNNYDIDR